jgi:MarR family transcriptional regulator, organic hydroperoxide resistance regulator
VPVQSEPDSSPSQRNAELGEVAGCFFELIGNIIGQAEQLAHRLNIPTPFLKVLQALDCPMPMKELGKRMHCDPSFVTLVADTLEKRGLARREPHPADRRVKNIVLTSDGEALKHRVETELAARMPWNRALDESERAQLLALIRKMLSAGENGADAGASVKEALNGLFTTALQDSIAQASAEANEPINSPAATGEVTDVVSKATAS